MRRFLFILCVLAILSPGCGRKQLFQNYFGETQGTTFNIIYEDKPSVKATAVNREIDRKLMEIDRSLSVYNPGSLISAINRNEHVKADELFTEFFEHSMKMSELTNGLFDITVGPLVKAWGFGPDAVMKFDSTIVDSLKSFVGYRKVRIHDGFVVKDDQRIWLDPNAIAPGYSVDVICRLLDGLGLSNYLVEIGGEVRAKGRRGERLWRVGVDKPYDNNIYPGKTLSAVIELDNEALATSGNYRRFYIEDGVKYSHTISPITGAPARNRLLSATIIADNAATADAFATACMVAGPEEAVRLIESNVFIKGFLIYSGDEGEYLTWMSEGLKDKLKEE